MTDHVPRLPSPSGHVSSPVQGIELATVLAVSTQHMPTVDADLSPWSWGAPPELGIEWIYAYDEDPSIGDEVIPAWLLTICRVARDKYNANWILLDPAGEVLPDFPTY